MPCLRISEWPPANQVTLFPVCRKPTHSAQGNVIGLISSLKVSLHCLLVDSPFDKNRGTTVEGCTVSIRLPLPSTHLYSSALLLVSGLYQALWIRAAGRMDVGPKKGETVRNRKITDFIVFTFTTERQGTSILIFGRVLGGWMFLEVSRGCSSQFACFLFLGRFLRLLKRLICAFVRLGGVVHMTLAPVKHHEA